jgi:hypothetical protein
MNAKIFFTGLGSEVNYNLNFDADVDPKSCTLKDGKTLIFNTSACAKIDKEKSSKDYKEAFDVCIDEKTLSVTFRKKDPGGVSITNINVRNNLLIITVRAEVLR